MFARTLRLRTLAFLAGAAMFAFGAAAGADPPARVARLGYMTGAVSFSPAGEDDWLEASTSRPLTTGDRLWSDAGARAEVQIGPALVRMNADTAVSILNLDDRIAQLQLTQGALNVRVRRLEPNEVFEVDTPNLAFVLRQPGEYRIEVDPDEDATTIVLRKGQGEVYGDDAAYAIDSRQPYRFTGTGLREYAYVDAPRPDGFDRWSSERDRRYDNSVSARYVSRDVVGYQDLDANGTWRVDATYGNVWIPHRVAADWAPYRDGHWAWIDPWGWTWVDDAPWGFAVSHYGRWAHFGETWGWIPGPVRSRAYYAPALVVFVGGANFQLTISSGNVGGVAWFPLAPREVYRPAYPVSRGYYENINRSNTVINNTVINNTYNNVNVTNVVYANRRVPGAVIAVPAHAFVQSQPVSKAAVRVSQHALVNAPVAVVAPVAPTERSVRGGAARRDKPPARAFERPVVARTAPPAAPLGFKAQKQQLATKPGRPLDEAERRQLRPAAAVPAPVVKVMAPAQTAAQPAAPAPSSPVAGKARDGHGKSDDRKVQASPQAVAPPQATPPAPAARPPEQRPKSGERSQRREREQPDGAAAPAAAPRVAAPSPAAEEPAQRARPGSERAARRAEPRPTVAAPTSPPLPPLPAPRVQSRDQGPAARMRGPNDAEKDSDEHRREEEHRRQDRRP